MSERTLRQGITDPGNPNLQAYARRYATMQDSSDGYVNQLKWAINSFAKFLRREPLVSDLRDDVISEFTIWLKEWVGNQTRRSRRNILLRLARAATMDRELDVVVPSPRPERIVRVKTSLAPVRCWSLEEVERLLAAAGQPSAPEYVLRNEQTTKRPKGTKVPQGLYWRAYVLAAWDTGLRGVDLRNLKFSDIDANGRIALVQKKTRKILYCQLRTRAFDAVKAIQEAAPDREGPFQIWCLLSVWRKIARRLVQRAGLDGHIGMLRHSSGTFVENLYPGRGAHHLGNTQAVFMSRYYDRRQSDQFFQPPELESPKPVLKITSA
jgi:integrase